MKKLIALLLALMLATAGLAAFAEAAEPVELIVAINAQFTTLDPALNTETVNNYAITHMYAGMFAKDEDNNAVNELCDTYEVSDDGLVYTFHMVKDAVWSDGVPVTANDFVYSYLRALSYGADNAWAVYDMVSYVEGAADYNAAALEAGESFDCTVEDASAVGFKALDDYTLEVKLSTPLPYLTKLMASNAWLPVRADFAPQHESLWAYDGGYPTSGAFTLQECNENENCVLQKNPSYLHADLVTVDTINYIVMTDGAAQTLAFKNGEIDVALGVDTDTAASYIDTDNLWIMPRASNYFLAINSGATGPDWAKDANIRRALALAIDRDALVDVLGGAIIYQPLYGYVPKGVSGVDGDFREEGDADGYTLTYDPEQAKALLAEAGYDESNPLSIVYKYSNNGMHGDVATMLQAFWKAIGVDTTFEAVESGVFYDQLDQGDFEISRYGYTASDDAKQFLDLWTRSMQVVAAVDDEAFDNMLVEAAKLTDPTEYYTELHKIEDYFCDENVYVIPLFNYADPALLQDGITGYRMLGDHVDFSRVVIER
ncbi:MAG: peptide ABC transporter substrate-binding protein [Clostridia bacterium]|nr:peptide ABC transporter substrate-binding protein [Clostridia bacterium]